MAALSQFVATAGVLGKQAWPEDVCLYQPYEVGQCLIPDFAAVLSVKAYLKMCDLQYREVLRTNAEFMSPSGKVPFIKAGPVIVSELDPIVSFVQSKGTNLSEHLSDAEKAEMKAYMSLIENTLTNAELYISWKNQVIWEEVTKLRYGAPYPWPLTVVLPLKKRWEMNRYLQAAGWADKSLDQVCEEVRTCCEALSEKLGEQEYFFGKKPTELDALAHGHLYTLTTTDLPIMRFAEIINSFPNLTAFCQRIDRLHFKENELEPS